MDVKSERIMAKGERAGKDAMGKTWKGQEDASETEGEIYKT